MQRIQVKKTGMEKYSGEICLNIHDKLEKLKVESRNYFATWCGQLEFEVDHFQRRYIVDLSTRTCSCKRWDLSSLPCSHAISAIQINHKQPETYVHEYYSKSRYLDTYAFMIHPVPDMYEYEEGGQKLNPPEAKKLAGIPKKLRNRQTDEPRNLHKASRKNINVTCAKCLQKGHNQRSCKNKLHPKSKLVKQRCTTGQSSQPASIPTPAPTPTPSTNIPSNEMFNNIQTRRRGQAASQPAMSTASIGLKRGSTRSSTQPTKLPTHGRKASNGPGKGPKITVGERDRDRGPINASASRVNVGRIGVNANVRRHAVSVTFVLETIKARRLHKELATGSK